MDIQKSTERSVDSLQRIYAFIVALAVGEAIRRFIINPKTGESDFNLAYVPSFAALAVTLVPFFHGMNRHLDEAYVATAAQKPPRGALLFDFVFFFIEAGVLFLLATMVTMPDPFFKMLAALFLLDAVWGAVTNWIGNGMGKKWAWLNVAAFVLTALFSYLVIVEKSANFWAMLVIATLRSLFDYALCWAFYFPSSPDVPTARSGVN